MGDLLGDAHAAEMWIAPLYLDDGCNEFRGRTFGTGFAAMRRGRKEQAVFTLYQAPGIYCLRTTLTEPSEAELWHIYSMLTDLESVFRSLKIDLGLRPVHHQIDRRVEGHLFISVLATSSTPCDCSNSRPGASTTPGRACATRCQRMRITATLQRRDGRTVHVRKASRPEPQQQSLYADWHLGANPGGTQRSVV